MVIAQSEKQLLNKRVRDNATLGFPNQDASPPLLTRLRLQHSPWQNINSIRRKRWNKSVRIIWLMTLMMNGTKNPHYVDLNAPLLRERNELYYPIVDPRAREVLTTKIKIMLKGSTTLNRHQLELRFLVSFCQVVIPNHSDFHACPMVIYP